MRAFLDMLQRSPAPALHLPHFRERIGDHAFDALLAAGVLERRGVAEWYPCGGPEGEGCPRRVVENPGDDEHPFAAVCGRCPPACETVLLTEEEVEIVAVSEAGLIRALRLALDAEGEMEIDGSLFPHTFSLGRTSWGGAHREAFLALRPWDPGIPAFLASRRSARLPSLVLAPTRWRVQARLADEHGPADRVEIVFLEDVLALEGGRLALRAPVPTGVAEPAAAYQAAPYCMLVDADGARPVDEATYREIAAHADDYDLFLDLLSTTVAGRHRACRRNGDAFEEGSLTHQQAGAYAELMERRRPLRAGELAALNTFGSPDKQVEAARRVLDVKLTRYEWRSSKLLRADDRLAKRYLFQPPEGLRWVLLRPLDGPP